MSSMRVGQAPALPLPLGAEDRAVGDWWDISMRQVEVSRTIVFDAPRHTRAFFEALCANNLDIAPPAEMQIVFGRRAGTEPVGGDRTRLVRRGDDVTINAYFRHSRVKSYLKEGRALRIETVINDPGDWGWPAAWNTWRTCSPRDVTSTAGWSRLSVSARVVSFASPAFERVARPTVEDGRRAPALRFGDPRVMPLVGAL